MRMIANSLVTTSLVVVAALAAMPARAANVDATSTVDAVTVYPDGASVTRVITFDLPAGDTTLVAKDFPLTLDPSSLRVEGEAEAKLTIGAIDAKPPRAANSPSVLPKARQRVSARRARRVRSTSGALPLPRSRRRSQARTPRSVTPNASSATSTAR